MTETNPITLKDWIENDQGVDWSTIVDHTIPDHHLSMNMEELYEERDYFNFHLWSLDYVYYVYHTSRSDWHWDINVVPRNPPEGEIKWK